MKTNPPPLPPPDESWRCFFFGGFGTGNDFVEISPTDDNFCVDCAYQIGLNSVGQSSFTVSVYRGDEGGGAQQDRWHESTPPPIYAYFEETPLPADNPQGHAPFRPARLSKTCEVSVVAVLDTWILKRPTLPSPRMRTGIVRSTERMLERPSRNGSFLRPNHRVTRCSVPPDDDDDDPDDAP